jgi:hypothetical protein
MRVVLLVVAVLALVGFVFVAYVIPQRAQSDAKDAAQSLIAGAEAAKQQVAAIAEKEGKLTGAGVGVKAANKADGRHGEFKWLVEGDGVIRGWNEKNGIEVSMTPSVQGGKVSWKCRGFPTAAMPASCGGAS